MIMGILIPFNTSSTVHGHCSPLICALPAHEGAGLRHGGLGHHALGLGDVALLGRPALRQLARPIVAEPAHPSRRISRAPTAANIDAHPPP